MFAVPLRDVVRLQFPLGHHGNPIVIGYTRDDLKIWRELVARIMTGVGIAEHDIIQVAFNYGLFMGAFRFNQGAELIGVAVVPASVAPADVQIRIMHDFRSTVLVSTPSFALHIIETMRTQGIDPGQLSLKIGLFGAEPWPESARSLIEEGLGIKAYDVYGVMELIEPGVSGECTEKAGLHIFEDHFFPEIIDPLTGQSLKEGEEGELVLTSLTTSAYPLIRYRTHDRTALCTKPCACGRTLVRMNRIFKRTDQMISVRGINVFPEMITEALSGIEGIGPEYSLVIKQQSGMNDQLFIRVNASPELMHFNHPMSRKCSVALIFHMEESEQEEFPMGLIRRDRVVSLWSAIAVCISTALFLSGCKKEQAVAPPQPPVVSVVEVVRKDIPVTFEIVDQTQSSHLVDIHARVSGFLDKRIYTEGEIVKQGQVLFLMDPKPFQAQLTQATAALSMQKASLATARSNLARTKPLAEQNALSQKDLDDASGQFESAAAAVEQAKAQVETAQLNLSYTTITSPVREQSAYYGNGAFVHLGEFQRFGKRDAEVAQSNGQGAAPKAQG